MKNHIKVYFNAMGYEDTDFIECEVCQQKAVDIHHIESRGSGGTGRNRIRGTKNAKDYIENLVALCRTCHNLCEQYKDFNIKVKELHLKYLQSLNICTQ